MEGWLTLENKEEICQKIESLNTNVNNMNNNFEKKLNDLSTTIDKLLNIIKEQKKEINDLSEIVKNLDRGIVEKTERDINKAIRSYFLNGNSTNFFPTKTNNFDKLF